MSTPPFFVQNAFNVAGLPTSAPISEAKKRITHLISLAKIEETEEYDSDLGAVAGLRSEAVLRRSLEKITSVRDRMREAFFWFELDTKGDVELLKKVRAGEFRDCIETWENSWIRSKSWSAKKNMAIALSLQAVREKNADLFSRCVSEWQLLWKSDEFWSFYAEHYCLHDDLGTSRELFKEFRDSVPQHFSQFVVEVHREMPSSGALTLFHEKFGYLGSEIEAAVVTPISRKLNSALDAADDLASSDKYGESQSAYKMAVRDISNALSDLRLLGIDSYTPIQVLNEKVAERLRSVSITLNNKHDDVQASKQLLNMAVRLAGSQSFQARVEKDKAQLEKNEFFAALHEQLELQKDDPEGRYRTIAEALDESPLMGEDEDFIRMRREAIFSHAMDSFIKGQKLFDSEREEQSIEHFARAHALLVSHIDDFSLNKNNVLEMCDELSREMLAISDPGNVELADRRMKEVAGIVEKLDIDDASKYSFAILCRSVIYRDIAPYLPIVRRGRELVQIGNFTWFLYGLGVVFWIGGYFWARHRPTRVPEGSPSALPNKVKKGLPLRKNKKGAKK